MCRKSVVRGLCLIALSLGLVLGNWIDSWLLCVIGGAMLLVLGLVLIQGR